MRQRELQQQLQLLAGIEPSDAPFVSCYIDVSDGIENCRARIEQRMRTLRQNLDGAAQVDFDHAVHLIRSGLASVSSEARSVALFARGKGGGQFFVSLPFAVPMAQRITTGRAPDILPLVRLVGGRRHFLLVLFRACGVQVSEIDNGIDSVKIWSALPGIRAVENRTNDSAHTNMEKARINIERCIRMHRNLPVVIAGDEGRLQQMCTMLQDTLEDRDTETIPLNPGKSYADSINGAIEVYQHMQDWETGYLADRMLQDGQAHRDTVTGVRAGLKALRCQQVESMILSGDFGQLSFHSCPACADNVEVIPSGVCPSCGATVQGSFDLHNELLRLAVQQGVAIRFVSADHALRYRGGVVCRLDAPAQERRFDRSMRHNSLGLVA